MTITTFQLKSFGGEVREATVIRIDREGFVIRWGFSNYTLHVGFNQLVRIDGNRVAKRFNWRAVDIETLRDAHYKYLTAKR